MIRPHPLTRGLRLLPLVSMLLCGSRTFAQMSDPPAPSINGAAQVAEGGFFSRLGKAYWTDWKDTAADSPAPPCRGFPAPESSPPFPFSDWPYGGSPVIGAPDTSGGPLMTAI